MELLMRADLREDDRRGGSAILNPARLPVPALSRDNARPHRLRRDQCADGIERHRVRRFRNCVRWPQFVAVDGGS